MQNNKLKSFFQKHWMDILIILAVVAILAVLVVNIGIRFKFPKKWEIF